MRNRSDRGAVGATLALRTGNAGELHTAPGLRYTYPSRSRVSMVSRMYALSSAL